MTNKITIDFQAKARGNSNLTQAISCTVFETNLNQEGSKKLEEIIQNDTIELLDTYTLLEKTDKSEAIPLGVKTIPDDCFDGFMKFIFGAFLSLIGLGAILLTVCGGIDTIYGMFADFLQVFVGIFATIIGVLLFKFVGKAFKHTDEKTVTTDYLLCFLFPDENNEISKIVFRKCSHPKYGDICRSVDYFNQQ